MEEFCPQCAELGFRVKVERYRNQSLERCTVHYWAMNARSRGWELDRYAEASEGFNFVCSLPTEKETALIKASLSR